MSKAQIQLSAAQDQPLGACVESVRFSQAIRGLRKGLGLTQAQLARRLSIRQNPVSRYELGAIKPSAQVLLLLLLLARTNGREGVFLEDLARAGFHSAGLSTALSYSGEEASPVAHPGQKLAPGAETRSGHHGRNLAAEVRAIRKYLKLTPEEFASALGVQWNTVNQWELGMTAPPAQLLRSMVAMAEAGPAPGAAADRSRPVGSGGDSALLSAAIRNLGESLALTQVEVSQFLFLLAISARAHGKQRVLSQALYEGGMQTHGEFDLASLLTTPGCGCGVSKAETDFAGTRGDD